MNCIGFAITIVSIQLLDSMLAVVGAQFLFLLLIPGPILGLLVLQPLIYGSAELHCDRSKSSA